MEKTGGSRLLQMQAKFQQKQLQERELKIASLYEAQQARALDRVRHSPAGATSPPHHTPAPVPHHPGKVRQMFEERRTKAGIDKSYPLQPIHNTERAPPRKPLPNGYAKVTSSTTKVGVERRTAKTSSSTVTSHIVKRSHSQKLDNRVEMVNGSGDVNHNHELDLNAVKHPHTNGGLIATDELDHAQNNYLLEDETFPEALAPAPTPRSPEALAPAHMPQSPQELAPAPTPQSPEPPLETKRPARRTPAVRQSKSPVKPKPPAVAATPPRRTVSENTVPAESNKPRGAMQRTTNSVPKRNPVASHAPSSAGSAKARGAASASAAAAASAASAASAAAAAAGNACAVCGRRFAPDRLAKHQEICKKAQTKKRKPFDVLKHRLAGTEAEPFISKLRKGQTASSTKVGGKASAGSWRQKHEEFIAAIRAAKQVQAHLNAGGKLSDLPPPPPSENPDYVKCPHCGRRFNQSAAERHIPKCANFQFNKPKPAAKRR